MLSVRPEDFQIKLHEENGIKVKIIDSVFLGLNTHYIAETSKNEKIEIVEESSLNHIYDVGTLVSLKINERKINVFSNDGERNLTPKL